MKVTFIEHLLCARHLLNTASLQQPYDIGTPHSTDEETETDIMVIAEIH